MSIVDGRNVNINLSQLRIIQSIIQFDI